MTQTQHTATVTPLGNDTYRVGGITIKARGIDPKDIAKHVAAWERGSRLRLLGTK